MRAYQITIIALLPLAGCQTMQPDATVDLAPLSEQIVNLADANANLRVVNERLKDANADLLATNEQLKATIRADADAGLAANAKGWLPFEKYVWGHQIQLLPVDPDEDTSAKWLEASTLYDAGGESAMQGVVNDLTEQAGQLNTKIGELAKAAETAQAERDAAQLAADEAMQRAQKAEQDLTAAVAKAVADEDARIAAETRAWQVRMANWAGAGLGALAAGCIAGAFFISAASKKLVEAASIALALCVGFLAFARLLSHPWFLPVAVGLYVVVGAAWAAWKIRTGIREREEAKVAQDNARIVADLVPMLDDYYDNKASAEARADMATKLFPALQAKGGAYDAAVKRFKAADCESRPPLSIEKSDAAL